MAKDFIEIMETGMRKSAKKGISKEDFSEMQKKEEIENEKAVVSKIESEDVEESVGLLVNADESKALKEKIVPLWKTASGEIKEKAKVIMNSHDMKTLDVEKAPVKMFEEILALLEKK
ncbi:hypothetical protein [uncultured Clostridium sp.]|uniref:hypothetical protein n=1 Tax=uncultured Clostridium sp. TaxID=59620 RepID=UPI0025F52B5F|nr:hypothetical protein [uncultured Clostridium sp.]